MCKFICFYLFFNVKLQSYKSMNKYIKIIQNSFENSILKRKKPLKLKNEFRVFDLITEKIELVLRF